MKKGHPYILVAQKMHTKSQQSQIIKSVAKPETHASIYITATPSQSSIKVDMNVFSGLWVNKQNMSLYTFVPIEKNWEKEWDFKFDPDEERNEINIGIDVNEKGVVVAILEGSQAEQYGIRLGWEIMEVTYHSILT